MSLPTTSGDAGTIDRQDEASDSLRTIGYLAIPETAAEAQRIFDEDIAQLGYVMNISRLWSYQPTTQTGLPNLLRQANAVEELSLRQRTILVCAYASVFGDRYCALVWGNMLAQESDVPTAAGVLRGVDHGLSSAERVMANWARKIARDPNSTTAADVEMLRAVGFTDSQIFAITTFVALRLVISTVNDALGLPSGETGSWFMRATAATQ